MTEVDIEALKQWSETTPAEFRMLSRGELAAIIVALEQGEDYRRRLKATNEKYIEISKKLDAALEDRERLRAASPDDLRNQGWSVAARNDYKLSGEQFTFWLFTKRNAVVKGEGPTDVIALNEVRARRAALEGHDG